MPKHTHTCTDTHMQAHIHTHTHTHTHIHMKNKIVGKSLNATIAEDKFTKYMLLLQKTNLQVLGKHTVTVLVCIYANTIHDFEQKH